MPAIAPLLVCASFDDISAENVSMRTLGRMNKPQNPKRQAGAATEPATTEMSTTGPILEDDAQTTVRPAGPLSRDGGSVEGSPLRIGVGGCGGDPQARPEDSTEAVTQADVEVGARSQGLLSGDPRESHSEGASLNTPPAPAQRSAPEPSSIRTSAPADSDGAAPTLTRPFSVPATAGGALAGEIEPKPVSPRLDDAAAARLRELVALSASAQGVTMGTVLGYQQSGIRYDVFLEAFDQQGGDDPALIAAYALGLTLTGHRLVSARRALSALAWRYASQGDVTHTGRRVLSALLGQNGPEGQEPAPVWPRGALLALVELARSGGPDHPYKDLLSVRDVAMVTTGVVGMLRPGEQTMARIEDLERHPRGYFLKIVGSKTNKENRRAEGVWFAARNDALDPVKAIDDLLEALARRGITDGPLFPSVKTLDDSRQGMQPDHVRERLRDIAGWGDLPTAIGGYTLRRSGATLLYLEGMTRNEISDRLRHSDPDSTLRYIDGLGGIDASAWLSWEIPEGWAPEAQRQRRMLGWDEIGPLEDLVRRALELAVCDALTVKPRTQAGHSNRVRKWRSWALANGADPEAPLPEEPGLFLIAEADRGVNPRTLRGYVRALDWWFTVTRRGAPAPIAVASAVVYALERSRGVPKSPQVESMDIEDLIVLATQPPTADAWRLPLCSVARCLDLPLFSLARFTTEGITFDEDGANLVVDGRPMRLTPGKDLLTCPVEALRFLVGRAEGGLLVTRSEAADLANVLWSTTGERNPSRLDDEVWAQVCQQFAMHQRIQLRNVVGICLGLGGLLGSDDVVSLHWEHLLVRPGGFVARGTPELPLPPSVEGRIFCSRSDALDLGPALTALAAVWPWSGPGLFGCSGPVLSGLDPRLWVEGRVALTGLTWGDSLRRFDKPFGFRVTALRLRVTGALEDWEAHGDDIRLQRRMGHRSLISTRDFLRTHSVLHESPTRPSAS